MNIVLVYNPKSGTSRSPKELRDMCASAGITVTKLIPLAKGFEEKLSPFIKQKAIIAVIGGDGTISSVAACVAGTDAIFAPLPGGTLNHFTKDLGVNQDLTKAIKQLTKTKERDIDVAAVNDIVFINNSSLGLYPASLLERAEFEANIGKWPAAVYASLRALVRFKTYRVTIDGETHKTPFIFVGNNRYRLDKLGGTERTKLDESILTVFIAKTESRLTLLKIVVFALIGQARALPEFEEYHPKTLSISMKRRRATVSHDGEVDKLSTPITYEIRPGALKVL